MYPQPKLTNKHLAANHGAHAIKTVTDEGRPVPVQIASMRLKIAQSKAAMLSNWANILSPEDRASFKVEVASMISELELEASTLKAALAKVK